MKGGNEDCRSKDFRVMRGAIEQRGNRRRSGKVLGRGARRWLTEHFGERVRFDEPMSKHTSFRVGGPADAFMNLRNLSELKTVTVFCREAGIPFLVVGDGTNLLVADGGIRGVVLTLGSRFREIRKLDAKSNAVTVRAMAGARTRNLCRFAIDAGLAGMNFAVGIPGTVGGALRMNAGTPFGCMAGVITGVSVLNRDGEEQHKPREALCFSYRGLALKEHSDSEPWEEILLSGDFRLVPSDKHRLIQEAESLLRTRREKQPWRFPSAGCFFKNPSGSQSAGALIDRAGFKGKRVGGAGISERHANFIINTGGATASDILRLTEAVQKAVRKAFGVDLELEVKIVGV